MIQFDQEARMTLPNSYEYILSVDLPILYLAIEKCLQPRNNGFELVDPNLVPTEPLTISYQSGQCKMKISCRRDKPYDDIELSILYGRLHAPFDRDFIEWNGEKCHCWHGVSASPLMPFLDGLSPAAAVELTSSKIVNDFFESSRGKEWTTSERFARMHAMIWKNYGQRFFDLFDLKYPDLWKEYVAFLKEYYEIDTRLNKTLKAMFNGTRYPFLYKAC
jgi:hypothetical protein